MRKQQPELWDVLAGARFILAFIVMTVHLQGANLSVPWLNRITELSAFAAVLAFLVISGYSIAHSISQRSDGFYRRRFLRIYPLYLVALFATFAPSLFSGAHIGLRSVGACALFMQTFIAAPPDGNAVIWSLAVEVACYVAAPLLQRLSTTTLLGITAVSAAAFAAFPHSPWHATYYAFIPRGAPLLLLGWAWMAGFIYYRHRESPSAAVYLLIGLIGLTTLNSCFRTSYQTITLMATVLCLHAGGSVTLPSAIRKILRFGGNISFPLYLIHAPILFVGVAHHCSGWTIIALALAASALALAIEPMIRRMLEQLLDTSAQVATAVSSEMATAQLVLDLRAITRLAFRSILRGSRQTARAFASLGDTAVAPPLAAAQ